MSVRNHPIGEFESIVHRSTQLVDVREPDEVATGTLPGATNIPLAELTTRHRELDTGRRVVVFCRSGARSARAAEFLSSLGFDDVVNLDGGMLALP